jgi:ATP-dependent Clp protease, protease subunit
METTKRMWEIRQSTQQSTIDIYIYGEVQGDYIDLLTLKNVESNTSAEYFKKELEKYQDVRKINIYINSFGGSVLEGTAIYNQLKRHTAIKTVYVDGFACSIAAVIAMAGDKVVMPKNTMMMIHNIWCSVCGNAEQLRKMANDMDKMMEANRQAYLQKSKGKISEKQLVELLDAETWLTAGECLRYGFADSVLDMEVDISDAKQKLKGAKAANIQKPDFHEIIAARVRQQTEKLDETLQKNKNEAKRYKNLMASMLR